MAAEPELALSHLRVLEIATDIAGPYAGKLFADAGADVVKVEGPSGDPLRRYTAGGPLDEGDSALFAFLNTSKRSVVGSADDPHVLALAGGADIVIVDAGVSSATVEVLRSGRPAAVVIAITPFGLTGPSAGDPATEFTLQARCGSTGGRGLADRIPLAAGGRLGEWIGGAYGAVAGLAYARRAREHGIGELVDVSLLEAMLITMGGLGVVAAQIMGAAQGRSLELPSIEPTADGYVGFCTITGQQFQDFLVLIEHPEWLGDADLASFAGRQRRRAEFDAAVRAWTTQRTTAEIVELASAMRIPVAPIGSPDTIAAIDHFVERGVFVPNPAGFVQPRPPYRLHGGGRREFTAAPAIGAHTANVQWPVRETSMGTAESVPPDSMPADPLADIRIMDLTAFWAGPAGSLVLGSLGADVVKVEGLKRPDGMRYAGGKPPTVDHWWETGSVFLAVNENKRDITLELGTAEGDRLARQLLGSCDVVMENFSPRVMTNLGLDWDVVSSVNPSALMVRMPAFGLSGPWRDRVGFAQTMEQVSGMAWLTGEADGAPVIPRGACDPIAGLHAAFATIVGLEHRRRTGAGALIEVTMVEAALNVAAQQVIEHSAYGRVMMRDGNRGPVAAPQGVYRCAGEDRWVAIAAATDAHWEALARAIGADELAADPALSSAAGRRAAADLIDAAVARWTVERTPQEAAKALQILGIPAEAVVLSADLLHDPQLQARGFFEELAHPYVGRMLMPAMPVVIGDPGHRWLRSAAPTLGEHNAEILGQLLAVDAETIAALEAAHVIGTRPAGL